MSGSDAQYKKPVIDVIDESWRNEKLPDEDVHVPGMRLETEDDADFQDLDLFHPEEKEKWTDLGLQDFTVSCEKEKIEKPEEDEMPA